MSLQQLHEGGETPELQRHLSNRHLQLIAIGGAIGTGLFMGSGKTISLAGPSIVFIYLIIGIMLYFMMRALGELLLSNLNYKSFIDMATDLIGEGAGFYIGWTYWFGWITIGIADLSAIVFYMQYFNHEMPFEPLTAAMISVASVLLVIGLNLVTVKLFGEMEFWFSMIKISAIILLVVVGLYLIFTGYTSPAGVKASFSHLTSHGGLFPKGIEGFLAGFQIAVFAFIGIELVGTTAAETADPEKNLPKAVNSIPIRVILFYVFALLIVMSVTPWNMINPKVSPFVDLFGKAGFAVAGIAMNLVVLSSVMSSMNSGVFSTSRMLFGLSKEHKAPAAFSKLSKTAVPAISLYFSGACLILGAVLQYLVPDAVTAFTLATTMSTILIISVWTMIMVCWLKYRANRPELVAKSIYRLPGGVMTCYAVIAFLVLMVGILVLEKDTFQALLYSPLWLIVLAIGYFGFYKPKMAKRNSGL